MDAAAKLARIAKRGHARIASIGECMVELAEIDLPRGQALVSVAGDTLNTAIYLAREGHGAGIKVSYVTKLGEGALSDQMQAQIAAEGIDCALIGRHPDRQPGLYSVERDARGERSFRYWRSESAARRLFSDGLPLLDGLKGFDVIHLSGITLAILPGAAAEALIAKCRALRARGALIAFDSNYRPRLWPDRDTAQAMIRAMWQATDLGLPSLDDERALWGTDTAEAVADMLAELGLGEVVVKNGAQGCLFRSGGAEARLVPEPVEVVDSTAAGDAFGAAYLAARLGGATGAEAMTRAHALAVRVLGHKGAILPASGG